MKQVKLKISPVKQFENKRQTEEMSYPLFKKKQERPTCLVLGTDNLYFVKKKKLRFKQIDA